MTGYNSSFHARLPIFPHSCRCLNVEACPNYQLHKIPLYQDRPSLSTNHVVSHQRLTDLITSFGSTTDQHQSWNSLRSAFSWQRRLIPQTCLPGSKSLRKSLVRCVKRFSSTGKGVLRTCRGFAKHVTTFTSNCTWRITSIITS